MRKTFLFYVVILFAFICMQSCCMNYRQKKHQENLENKTTDKKRTMTGEEIREQEINDWVMDETWQ
mgnify:FL=1